MQGPCVLRVTVPSGGLGLHCPLDSASAQTLTHRCPSSSSLNRGANSTRCSSSWVGGGGAGVRQAVLLGLLGGAGLPLGQGRPGVAALGGAAAAAEKLAFDVPEAFPIVEPAEGAALRPAGGRPCSPVTTGWPQSGLGTQSTEDQPTSGSACVSPKGSSRRRSPHLPQLLPSLDQAGAEEGDPGEPQVLVGHEDAHGHQVGLAVVVYEAADIPVEPSVNAVHLSILRERGQAWGHGV